MMDKCRLCPSCSTMLYGKRCNCGYTDIKEFITEDMYYRCYTRNANHPAYNSDFRDIGPYKDEITPEIIANTKDLLIKVNSLFTELEGESGKEIKIILTSGWRPQIYSKELGLSLGSNHCFGLAVDIADIQNLKYKLLEKHLEKVKSRTLALEHKSATRSWLHIQSRLPRSGNTIFYP